MRFSQKILLFILLIGSGALLWAGGQQEAATKEGAELPQVTWKLAGVHAVTTPETKGLNHFAELVKEMSGGKFIVNIYPAGQLGKDAVAMVENLMMSSIEMFGNVMDWNQHLVKDYAILAMPFLFEDIEAVKKFQQGSIYQEIGERLIQERGVRLIADNWYRLPKVLLAKRPIASLEDLKGLNMRMPSLKTYFETWKALGAKPTVIPWAEAFLSLQKGVVDGMDSPLGSIYGMKFYQAANYIMMTNHLVAPMNILVNEQKFQELPVSYQNILLEVGKKAGDYYTQLVIDMFKEDKQKMEAEGAQFLEIDTRAFISVAAKVAEKFEAEGMWKEGLFKAITESQ